MEPIKPVSNISATTNNPPNTKDRPPHVPLAETATVPDIPSSTHEFFALLQAGMSYELVNWLAKRLQFVAEQLVQEHKNR